VELGPFDRHARGLRRDASRAPAAAVDFALDVPVRALRATDVVVGEDFRFGHRGAGDVTLLRRLGARHGFTAHGVELLAGCSSTQVRVDAAGRLFVEPGPASGTVTVDYVERM
jgi:FAD synthase